MKKKKQIFLHIGLYKTGSTYLQKNIFEKINKNDFYISLKNYNSEINNELTKINYFNKSPSYLKKKIRKIKSQKLLISNEGLFGNLFNGFKDVKKRLDIYEKIFNKPIYIIFVREQSELLFSFYKERVKHGYIGSFEKFINCNKEVLLSQKFNQKSEINFKYFDYNKILKFYFKLPKKRVAIFKYESFFKKKKKSKLIKLLNLKQSNFPNTKENVSLDKIEYLHILNQYFLFKFIKIFFIFIFRIKNRFKKRKNTHYFNNYLVSNFLKLSFKVIFLINSKIIKNEHEKIQKIKREIKNYYKVSNKKINYY